MVGLNCYVDPTVELNCETVLFSFTSSVSEIRYLGWLGPGLRLWHFAARNWYVVSIFRKGGRESEKEISLGAPSESRLPKFR